MLALGTVPVWATSPASARPLSCAGVWVVVDATALGGQVTTRCAPGEPATGLDALTAAGHGYAFVPRNPGMVCTLDGRPQPCNGAPADAYWSYWHAEPGGGWVYATRGAGTRTPVPGGAEGWRFGDGSTPPGTPPPAPSAPPEPDPAPPAEAGTDPEPATSGGEGTGGADVGVTHDGEPPASGPDDTTPDAGTSPGTDADEDDRGEPDDGPAAPDAAADGPDTAEPAPRQAHDPGSPPEPAPRGPEGTDAADPGPSTVDDRPPATTAEDTGSRLTGPLVALALLAAVGWLGWWQRRRSEVPR